MKNLISNLADGSKIRVIAVNNNVERNVLMIATRQETTNANGELMINRYNDILTVSDAQVEVRRSVGQPNQQGSNVSQPQKIAVEGKYTAFTGADAAVLALVEQYIKPIYEGGNNG